MCIYSSMPYRLCLEQPIQKSEKQAVGCTLLHLVLGFIANHVLGYSNAHHIGLPSYEPWLSKDIMVPMEKKKKEAQLPEYHFHLFLTVLLLRWTPEYPVVLVDFACSVIWSWNLPDYWGSRQMYVHGWAWQHITPFALIFASISSSSLASPFSYLGLHQLGSYAWINFQGKYPFANIFM